MSGPKKKLPGLDFLTSLSLPLNYREHQSYHPCSQSSLHTVCLKHYPPDDIQSYGCFIDQGKLLTALIGTILELKEQVGSLEKELTVAHEKIDSFYQSLEAWSEGTGNSNFSPPQQRKGEKVRDSKK